MLVIARKVGQSVLIGDGIEITVSAVRGDQVRLAIKAPREVSILRSEVVRQVELGNVEAIESAAGVIDLVAPDAAPREKPAPGAVSEPPSSRG